MQNPGYDGFVWFIGVVEDIHDPKKLGRVRVRLINEYGNRVRTEDIPWATPLMPITSASFLGVGQSPTGITEGARVVGFFMDGDNKSKPMILGTFPIINGGKETEHSVSRQARGVGPTTKEYIEEFEPPSKYAAEYPYNKTITTTRGHVIEIDDTPKSERIHIYHRSGTYIEMFPDGSIVTKSTKNNTEITVNDKDIYAHKGDISIVANEGGIIIKSGSMIDIEAPIVNITGAMINING
jgi:Gp5 N-terminal OB domain